MLKVKAHILYVGPSGHYQRPMSVPVAQSSAASQSCRILSVSAMHRAHLTVYPYPNQPKALKWISRILLRSALSFATHTGIVFHRSTVTVLRFRKHLLSKLFS